MGDLRNLQEERVGEEISSPECAHKTHNYLHLVCDTTEDNIAFSQIETSTHINFKHWTAYIIKVNKKSTKQPTIL